jgi:hypothetical protein
MKVSARDRILLVAAGSVVALALYAAAMDRRKDVRAPAGPSPSSSLPRHDEDKPRLLARVGPTSIFSDDLARYMTVRELTFGVTSSALGLKELCDRALLVLLAKEDSIEPTKPELDADVLRKQLMIGATAVARAPAAAPLAQPPGFPRAAPGLPPQGPSIPASPFDRAASVLAEAGLRPVDLGEEAKADVLAEKAKERHVYEKIDVSQNDVLSAYRADAQGAADAGATKGPPKDPDESTLSRLRERIRRQRGAPQVASLLEELRGRWNVDLDPH